MPTTDEILANYTAEERADYERVARMMHGQITDLGGGNTAVKFTEDVEDFDGHYLAALDDFAEKWIVTFERDGEDGQRDWVEAHTSPVAVHEHCAEAFIVAARAAAKGELL